MLYDNYLLRDQGRPGTGSAYPAIQWGLLLALHLLQLDIFQPELPQL